MMQNGKNDYFHKVYFTIYQGIKPRWMRNKTVQSWKPETLQRVGKIPIERSLTLFGDDKYVRRVLGGHTSLKLWVN
jgi:hypothetical protein